MKLELALIHSKRLGHTRAYFGSPDVKPPPPRNLTNEMLQTVSGFEQTAPRQYALNATYNPLYAGLGLDTQRQNLYGFDDASGVHHPGTLELGRTSASYQRRGDIADVAALGPAAFTAYLNANPLLARSLLNLSGRTEDSPILQSLNQQALTGLQSGGQLTPQEARAADQHSRSGYADRGTYGGNQSLAAEILNRDALVRQRQQQAQQFASGVQGLNLNQADLVGRASQIFGTQLSDPFQAVLGRSSGANSGGGGGQQMIGTGARLFDPLNPYAEDVYNTNYNAQASANIANANNQAATKNATLTASAALLGALLSDKRLKKDVRKTGRKTRDGIPIVTGRYKTDPKKRRYEFVLAQDVEKKRPDAVVTDPFSGVKAVDYSKIEAPFAEVRKILRRAA